MDPTRPTSSFLSSLKSLLPFGGTSQNGIPAVVAPQIPLPVAQNSQKNEPSLWPSDYDLSLPKAKITITNNSDSQIGYVEVLKVNPPGSQYKYETVLRTQMIAGQALNFMKAPEADYLLLVSKTTDTTIPLFASDSFLVEGHFRHKMARAIREFSEHSPIRSTEGILQAIDRGEWDLAIPNSIPQQMKKYIEMILRDTYENSEIIPSFEDNRKLMKKLIIQQHNYSPFVSAGELINDLLQTTWDKTIPVHFPEDLQKTLTALMNESEAVATEEMVNSNYQSHLAEIMKRPEVTQIHIPNPKDGNATIDISNETALFPSHTFKTEKKL